MGRSLGNGKAAVRCHLERRNVIFLAVALLLCLYQLYQVGLYLYSNLPVTKFPVNGSERNNNDKNTSGVKVKKWTDDKDDASITATINAVHEFICNSAPPKDWAYLCSGNFVKTATRLLMEGEKVSIVQFGAHVGFEENDPLASGLSGILHTVINITNATELRTHFHWTFVEPSPPNFKGLEANIKKNAHICDMKSINVAVVSDLAENPGEMVFYGISDSIDPETGMLHTLLMAYDIKYHTIPVSFISNHSSVHTFNISRV